MSGRLTDNSPGNTQGRSRQMIQMHEMAFGALWLRDDLREAGGHDDVVEAIERVIFDHYDRGDIFKAPEDRKDHRTWE